jgi:hypothetical protein
MFLGNPDSNPRPNRMIHCLKDKNIIILCSEKTTIFGIPTRTFFDFEPPVMISEQMSGIKSTIAKIKKKTPSKLTRLGFFVKGELESVSFPETRSMKPLIDALSKENFDVIISHELELLPLAFKIKQKRNRVLFDAREYFPKNFDDQWLWRIQKKPFLTFLCNKYLRKCDKIITVSDGLANEFHKEFGVEPEVIMSLPPYSELFPSITAPEKIRIIHHGNISYSRRPEVMIEMMVHVDERFSLDLMLMVSKGKYWDHIVKMVGERSNVRIIPPVPMQNIISFINSYDIGLFLVPPTNFNLEHSLGNKFFEFIQARLAVAIGPNIDMKTIVEKYHCGIISDNFKPESLAEKLNKLGTDEIMNLKQNSNIAAGELCAEVNEQRLRKILLELTST